MATDPGPGGAPILDARAMAAQLLQGQPATTNEPFVPLWKVRPYGDNAAHQGNLNKLDAMSQSEGDISAAKTRQELTSDSVHTADYADSAFLDMSPADQTAFKTKAVKAGMIKDDATPAQIIQAWQNAVAQAEKYNKARPADKNKWISPFEAVDKLAINAAADNGAAWDGFSRTVSSKQYSESEVKGNAISILQRELMRDPTDAEVKAFTLAINHQSALNPTITTSQQYPAGADGAAPFTATTQTGGIDPNQILLDQVRSSPEHAKVDAAAVFYPALLQALGSVA